MKPTHPALTQLYDTALRAHLSGKARPDPEVTARIGASVRTSELHILEFAKLHENILVMELLPGVAAGKHAALIRRAGDFFAAAVASLDGQIGSAEAIGSLSTRNVELAREIIRQGELEAALRTSENNLRQALEKSEEFKLRMRDLSRQILSAQEDERMKISHELHDVVAQTLAIINLRLATLKTEAGISTKRLIRNISLTQRMVAKSAESVYQFARELRPAALDDLGLIPALHSLLRDFTRRTGVRSHLTAFKGVEKISSTKRTVLYRVAQEAINNVGRHARASRVEVTIRSEQKFLLMQVIDDGISFQAGQPPQKRGRKSLGLLGMKERLEMIGGFFETESAPGEGTTITARIPIGKATGSQLRDQPADTSIELP